MIAQHTCEAESAWICIVRSNFLGTHFTTYDSGENPSHQGFTTDVNNVRRELVAVAFVRRVSVISMLLLLSMLSCCLIG